MVFAQTISLRNSQTRFDKLLYQLNEVSKSGTWALSKEAGGNESASTKDLLRLKNRRHVWLNCERILRDIESRHAIVRQPASSIWTSLGNLTTRKVISVSGPYDGTPEVTSDAYIVTGLGRETSLLGIIAHFAHDGHIVGVEFQLSHGTSRQLFGMRSDKVKAVAFDSNAPIVAVMMSFGSLRTNQNESAMFGLGIVVGDHPSEPSYIIGALDGRSVIQILRADPGMEIIGITGKFNAQTITAFGIITANKTFTPANRVFRNVVDLQATTWWVGSHPPLDWPLSRYELSPRYGDSSSVETRRLELNLPVFDAPAYFLNLTERRVTSIKAFWTLGLSEAHSNDEVIKAFIFKFIDGSTETVGRTRPNMKESVIQRGEGEEFTDLRLYFANPSSMIYRPAMLCGVQFITNLNRDLSLGHTETHLYWSGAVSSGPKLSSAEDLRTTDWIDAFRRYEYGACILAVIVLDSCPVRVICGVDDHDGTRLNSENIVMRLH